MRRKLGSFISFHFISTDDFTIMLNISWAENVINYLERLFFSPGKFPLFLIFRLFKPFYGFEIWASEWRTRLRFGLRMQPWTFASFLTAFSSFLEQNLNWEAWKPRPTRSEIQLSFGGDEHETFPTVTIGFRLGLRRLSSSPVSRDKKRRKTRVNRHRSILF